MKTIVSGLCLTTWKDNTFSKVARERYFKQEQQLTPCMALFDYFTVRSSVDWTDRIVGLPSRRGINGWNWYADDETIGTPQHDDSDYGRVVYLKRYVCSVKEAYASIVRFF